MFGDEKTSMHQKLFVFLLSLSLALVTACSDDGASSVARDAADSAKTDSVSADTHRADTSSADTTDVAPIDASDLSEDSRADLEPPEDAVEDITPPPPIANIYLNEISCSGDEWIELVNLNDVAADLSGWTLSDDPANPLARYALPPGSVIFPNSYLLLRRQTETLAGFEFGLSCERDSVALLDPDGKTRDLTSFGPLEAGVTWGRLPDGEGAFAHTAATPGARNHGFGDVAIIINEVSCRGEEEWIELENIDDSPTSLVNWRLGDDPNDPEAADTYDLSSVGAIAPGARVVVRAQSRDEDGFLFSIGCNNDTIALWRPEGVHADVVTTGGPRFNSTWGRLPDGAGEFTETLTTPGAENQPFVDLSDDLFDPLQLHAIRLEADPSDLALLGQYPYEYVPAVMHFTADDGTAHPPLSVGIRIKGRLGSYRPLTGKSALKIKINWDDTDQRFFGLKKLTINNMVQDSSTIHEWTAYTIFRAMGVPCPRTGYVEVWINDEPYGLYLHLETMDDVALKDHFESTRHLFEGSYGDDIVPNDLWDLQVDEGSQTRRDDLQELIFRLPTLASDNVYNGLDDIIDWDETLTMMAIEIFIGHWDGYAPTRNNYYIHFDDAGVASWMPWGTDQTFSRELDFYSGQGLLFNRCLEDPICYAAYNAKLIELLGVLQTLDLPPSILEVSDALVDPFARDPRRSRTPAQRVSAVAATIDFLNRRQLELNDTVACLLSPDPDPDNDGYLCQQDCLPDDPNGYPGAPEICSDGIDQDCSGWPDDAPNCPDCFDRWRGPHRYLICTLPRTYDEARAECQAQGSELAIINDLTENQWLHADATALRGQSYWIGLTDRAQEGSFVWFNNQPPTYTNWNPGEPNDAGGGEDCAHIWSTTPRWNDIPCGQTMGVLCEDLCGLGELDADIDGHGRCGDDCDDSDPNSYPGAPEICGDGVDQDCDGVPDNGCP